MKPPTPFRAEPDAITTIPGSRDDVGAARAARLFDRYADRLLRYLTSRAGPVVAEDLLSEVFVVVLRSTGPSGAGDPDLSAESREGAWLFGVATNLLRRHRRDQIRTLRASDRLAHATTHTATDDDIIAGLDAAARVRDFTDDLLRLDPADLDLLLLIAWGGLTPTEAAASLGIPAGTARSRLHRIRTTLRRPSTSKGNHHD